MMMMMIRVAIQTPQRKMKMRTVAQTTVGKKRMKIHKTELFPYKGLQMHFLIYTHTCTPVFYTSIRRKKIKVLCVNKPNQFFSTY